MNMSDLLHDSKILIDNRCQVSALGEAVRMGLKAIATIPDSAKLWLKLVELGEDLAEADRVTFLQVLDTCTDKESG